MELGFITGPVASPGSLGRHFEEILEQLVVELGHLRRSVAISDTIPGAALDIRNR